MATKKPMVESATPASDKKKALETAMAQIERTYGKGSIMRLGENVDAISGATVTSKAIVRSVNSASAYVTGADISSSATTWGG